ncbi:MAG TPA: YcxB family protein [Polyangiaceae bacterium]|nr:YcxB family protein [Polyangiaceae bacterium]
MADEVESVGEADDDDEVAAINGELELVEADLIQAAAHLPELKRRWAFSLVIFVFCTITVLLNHNLGVSWTSVLPIAVGCGFFAYFQHAVAKKWPKRALAELGEGKMTFRFDEQGMSIDSKLRQMRYAWPALARYLEAPESFIVYPTPRSLFVVPKRAFTEAELPEIRELLQTRIVQKPGGGSGLKRMVWVWLALVVTFTVIWHFLDEAPAPKAAPSGQAPDGGPAH